MLRAMRAVVRDGSLKLASFPMPTKGLDEVIVSVRAAGICRTDLYAADGRLRVKEPRVLGHEAAGVVEMADGRFDVGTHVVIEPALSCRALAKVLCRACEAEGPCATPTMLGVDRDGAFADFVSVPSSALHRIPSDMRWEVAAMAEPLAAALGVLRAPIRGRGAVYGTGRIADLLVRVLEEAGLAPIPWNEGLSELDWVVEARAEGTSLDEAMCALRPQGTLVLKSRPAVHVSLDVALAVRRELTLVGRSYGSFADAVAWLGRVALDDLIGEVFPIERFEAAFAAARVSERQKIFFSLEH